MFVQEEGEDGGVFLSEGALRKAFFVVDHFHFVRAHRDQAHELPELFEEGDAVDRDV